MFKLESLVVEHDSSEVSATEECQPDPSPVGKTKPGFCLPYMFPHQRIERRDR